MDLEQFGTIITRQAEFLLENWRFTFWVAGLFSRYLWLDGWWTDRLTILLWCNLRHTLSAEILYPSLYPSLTSRGHMTKILSNSTPEADREINFLMNTVHGCVPHSLSRMHNFLQANLCCWKQGHMAPCCAKRNLCSRAVSEKNRMTRESIPKSWQGNLSRMNCFTRTCDDDD